MAAEIAVEFSIENCTALNFIALPAPPTCDAVCSRSTGLYYAERGLRTPINATIRGYRVSSGRANRVRNLGSTANPDATQIARAACGKDSITDPECADVLLLALTPAAYSSNNTADTPGRRAFISPAQVRQEATLKPSWQCQHWMCHTECRF
jgi:hypothetical protein